ncbi:MAG: undecaprenyl-diphosphate phosphatase [Phycisphaerales bacterium]|nr:undecaprenyl-diphosphate phosphatase [Phycisphaerales bacterium]
MTYLISVLLGIIEGLTEFLPVSSTAHLRIVQDFLGLPMKNEYWKMYSVVIQLGAILSVLVLYGQRLLDDAKTFPWRGKKKSTTGKHALFTHPFTLIAIAFVTTAIPAYFLDKKIGETLENLYVIAGALILGGIVMWLVDALLTRPIINNVESMSPLHALWIGAVQILSAVFPGTSRSMSTIAAGQIAGMSRSAALDFSFLVSLPVMFAATAYKFLQSLKEYQHNPDFIPANFNANPWLVLAIGFVVSFFVALIVNRWFIHWVRKHGFTAFAIYRLILGAILIVLLYLGFLK